MFSPSVKVLFTSFSSSEVKIIQEIGSFINNSKEAIKSAKKVYSVTKDPANIRKVVAN